MNTDVLTPVAASRRPRLLCLAPQEPWPATDGGKEGIHGAVDALSASADLLLACPGRPADLETAKHYAGLGVDYRPVDFVPQESLSVILSATLQLKPFKFHKYGNSTAETAFAAVIGDWRPDAIVCFHAHMEALGQRLRRRHRWSVPVVVREHNIEYELVASYIAALRPWQRRLAAPIEWLTRRAERAIWRRADATAFLSDRDFATARASGVSGRLVLAPEGVPIPPMRCASRPATAPRLLIPLNRKAPQSVANLRSFLHDYWLPLISRGELADVTLAVTGVTPEQLADLVQIDPQVQAAHRIAALGFLPSLQPAFESALALVAPTFIGGGIRKKILEGMAHQVPVIATDLDINTCNYFRADQNILRLGTPAEFAASVHRLVEDDALWHQLSLQGRQTVETHADWRHFAEVMLSEIASVRLASYPNVALTNGRLS